MLVNSTTTGFCILLVKVSETRYDMIPMKTKHKLVKSLDDFAKWVKEKQSGKSKRSGLVDLSKWLISLSDLE